jgi:hypothetical protein
LAAAAGSDTGGSARFYSNLYIGLWHEAHGDEQVCTPPRAVGSDAGEGGSLERLSAGTVMSQAARQAMTAAAKTPYAQQSGDYMAALAGVHCLQRGWAGRAAS